jgi:hypothetical protein
MGSTTGSQRTLWDFHFTVRGRWWRTAAFYGDRQAATRASGALTTQVCDVERNMLTVKAERRPVAKADDVQMELSERPLGVFSRQIVLADTLDTEHIKADYEAGVLTLRIPIAERAKPRKIAIVGGSDRKEISG